MGIRNWLRELILGVDKPARPIAVGHEQPVELDAKAATRFTIARAINGHVIQIGRFKPNPHGPDWTHDMYLVPDGADMMEAIKTSIALGALNK
jgi:hypothetical protein